MKLLYEGVDIMPDVNLESVIITDRAGGKADTLDITFTDTDKLWPDWEPAWGDNIQVIYEAFDTGIMYVDIRGEKSGRFRLGASGIPPAWREEHEQSWESIQLSSLLQEFAGRYRLQVKTYGTDDHLYARLSQSGQPDMQWLAYRCMFEGYSLKLTDKSLVVFSESYMEQQAPTKELDLTQDKEHSYQDFAFRVCRGCRVMNVNVTGEFMLPSNHGRVLKARNISASSVGEAERYAKGLLRMNNKRAYSLIVRMPLDYEYAAGEMVDVRSGSRLTNGAWFLYEARHDFIAERTELFLRKPLEGY